MKSYGMVLVAAGLALPSVANSADLEGKLYHQPYSFKEESTK